MLTYPEKITPDDHGCLFQFQDILEALTQGHTHERVAG